MTETTTNVRTPEVVDAELATAHREMAEARQRVNHAWDRVHSDANDSRRVAGRRRVWQMSHDQAREAARKLQEESGDTFYGMQAGRDLEMLALAELRVARLSGVISRLDDEYTGWSRFFLVQSKAGHVHRSMSCSTCRPTTRFGWLPHLSGRTEADAVNELGAMLCTVCFPSAPVEWTNGTSGVKATA